MIFDAIIVILIVFTAVRGYRKGFFYMFMRILTWAGAIAAAVFLTKPVSDILENGIVGEAIAESLREKFASSVTDAVGAFENLPAFVSGGITAVGESSADIAAGMLTGLITSILAFVLVVFCVWLLFHIFIRPASRHRRSSVIGGIDRLLGTAAGAVKALIIVLVLLALMVPAVNLTGTDLSSQLTKQLSESYIAGALYDSNPLLLIGDGLFL